MKTILHIKFLFAAILILLVAGIGTAQNYDGSKTLNKTTTVPKDVTIQMENHSGDLKIITSGDNSAMIKTTVEISGNSKEDVDKVIAAIENFRFKLSGNILEVDTRFYKSMNTINSRTTMTLLNGDKVKIKEYKIRHELQIPKSAKLKLTNKYSDIEMQSLDGDAGLVMYSSKLFGENLTGNVTIESKYSKINFKNIGGNSDFDFYDSDVEIASCQNMNLKSKYSKFDIGKAGEMKIDSYDDKFKVADLSGLNLIAKYSDFESLANVNDVRLELYDSNIKIKSAKNVAFNGKYCDLVFGDVATFKSGDSYDNNVYLENTKEVEVGTSKYCLYEIKSVTKMTMDDIYDETIKIDKLENGFSGLSVNGKYGKMEVTAGSVPFKVDFKIKYPKVDIPPSVKISKQIKDNSDLELLGGESGGTIKVEGYDMKVVVK